MPPTTDTSSLRLLSAPSREALIQRVVAARDGQVVETQPTDRFRLAIVAVNGGDLTLALDQAASQLNKDDKAYFNLANRIFFGCKVAGGQPEPTAFLFPGFGARHHTLLDDLIKAFPAVRRWFDDLAPALRERFQANPLLFPSLAPPAASGDAPLLLSLEAALMGSLALKSFFDRCCPSIRCDSMAGHSHGEMALLVAAGILAAPGTALDFLDEMGRRLWANCLLDKTKPVALLAVNASLARLASGVLREGPDWVRIALDNCPTQKILCGQPETMANMAAVLRAEGLLCYRLPGLTVPVHTPSFPLSDLALGDLYSTLALSPPRFPAYSCATAGPFPPDTDALRAVLCAQWRQPVRFSDTITRLYDDGIRTFVEMGPGGHLTGFVRDILRERDASAIATNLETQPTLLALHTALGQLFARGHALDPATFQTEDPVTAPTIGPVLSASRATKSALTRVLARLVAELMDMDNPDLIDPQRGFFDLGLGSIQAVALADRIQSELHRTVSPTVAFDHPSIAALAAYLDQEASPANFSVREAEQRDAGLEEDGHVDGRIAIVGMACRLPGGVASPEDCRRLLREAGDAIRDLPEGRWDLDEIRAAGVDTDSIGHIFRGGFLNEIRDFDCGFFGIARREALTLDPQQRLLLELTREALDHAAIPAGSLAGSNTGVFVGISNADYAQRLSMAERLAIGGHLALGNTNSTAAGRLSFVLGLNGPCLALDTACSSSLVAVHLACRSLRSGEARLALAGGVNLLVSPETSIFLARAGALSPDGQCRTFGAEANGYVRGEGGGVVVLKRLADAQADGDRILAVIRGSAINNDGRTSGFTVPNGTAQQGVIRGALTDAGVAPEAIDYVEAHGTGTSLGDPIEVSALGAVFGDRPAEAPLLIGSIKTNIGHLEAAAGVAALIKVVLQIEGGEIFATRCGDALNPHIAWDRLPMRVARLPVPWARTERPRLAGVSSFGISGTNAHVVLAEPPPAILPPALVGPRDHQVLTLSARGPTALDALRRTMLARLADAEDAYPDLCVTSTLGRDHLDYRLWVVAPTAEKAADALRTAASVKAGRRPSLAFLFSGQGSQQAGMGRDLFASEPVFRDAINACEEGLRPLLDTPLTDIMFRGSKSLDATINTQPCLFALQYALWRLWQSWGVEPDMVLGHSIGEYAAACAAGVFNLSDGLRLVASRGRLMQSLPAGGGMLAVSLGEPAARTFLDQHGLDLSIAAVNSAETVVLSGPAEQLDQASVTLATSGTRSTRLLVSHAFHSALMDPILGEFRRVAETVAYAPPRVPLVSNLTGQIMDRVPNAGYWADQLRQTVRFAEGVATLRQAGCGTFLELGPRPVLTALALTQGDGTLWRTSLSPPMNEGRTMLESLAALHSAGVAVDWARFQAGRAWRRAVLPATPFERQRLWIERNGPPSATPPRLPPPLATALAAPETPSTPAGPASVGDRVRGAALEDRGPELERYLRHLVASVLGGADPQTLNSADPLNRFGMDSLMALALRAEVAAQFGLDLKLTYLVGEATLDGLATRILTHILAEHHAPPLAGAGRPTAGGATEEITFPLSQGQRALWFLWRVSPDSSAYALSLPLTLPSGAEPGRWHAACRTLVASHSLLRARFHLAGDTVMQRIAPADAVDWQEENAEDRGTDVLRQAMVAAHGRPFDLEADAPVRFHWFQRSSRPPILLITLHHIVADGWSLEIIRRQLPRLLTGPASPPTAHFADHVRREAEMLAGTEGERLWLYWRDRLSGSLPLLDLPLDRPRPAIKGFRGAARAFTLPAELSDRLRALARDGGTTLYVTMLAAFLALLHRFTGQDDLLVGSPQSGRERPGMAEVVGYFVDPIVIRSRLDETVSVRDFLALTRTIVMGALDHAAFPFPLLVERLRPERLPGRSPLFDASFNFIPAASAIVVDLDLPQGDGKFDLTLNIRDGATLSGWFSYDTALLLPETVDQMVEALALLLPAMAEAPDASVTDLPLSRQGVFVPVLFGRSTAITADDLVHRRFLVHAAGMPDAPAVVAPDTTLTYGDLARRVAGLGHLLHVRGVGKASGADRAEVLVGLVAHPTAASIVAILALQRVGATPVLIDPSWPAALVIETLLHHGVRWALATAAEAYLATAGLEVVPHGTAEPAEAAVASAEPEGATLENGAYVIFTSGSTGRPKGVRITQRSLANYVTDMIHVLGARPMDRFAVVSTLAADLSFTMVFPALASGGCLHLLSDEVRRDGAMFADYMIRHAIDHLKIVPSHFAALTGRRTVLPARTLVLGGERAAPDWVASLRQTAPSCRILNHYGPTETTIGVLTGEVDGDVAEQPGDSLPLTRAMANNALYLLDRRGHSVPTGAMGELCVAGHSLMEGYLRGEAPLLVRDGVTLYRTGDLARETTAGTLRILGRRDRQVKIRGHRIELAQVEAALRAVPGVREALVIPDREGPAAMRLLGFVVASGDAAPTETSLLRDIAASLPGPLVPGQLCVLAALPLTPNGKADTVALRALAVQASASKAAPRLPRDAIEIALARIWSEVLEVPEPGISDDFFQLGGHSLLVVSLLARIQEQFGRSIPLAAVLTHPTIEGLAALLRANAQAGDHQVLVPLGPATDKPNLFLLPGAGGSVAYLLPLARDLAARWRCWGLQAIGHASGAAIPDRIEDIAADYVARIREVQPDGAVRLVGHSFGALVAYEMARRIQAAGGTVALLGLLDNAAPPLDQVPTDQTAPERSEADWLRHIAHRIAILARVDLRLGGLATDDHGALAECLRNRLIDAGLLPADIQPAQFRRFIEIYMANARAAAAYRPRTLPAAAGALVVRASDADADLDQLDRQGDPTLGWRVLLGDPALAAVPGTHLTMFVPPHHRALAEAITAFGDRN